MGNLCCSQRELSAKVDDPGGDGQLDPNSRDVQKAALSWERLLDERTDNGASSTNGYFSPQHVASSTLQDELMRLQSENAALKGQLGIDSPKRGLLGTNITDQKKESPVYVLPGGLLRPALDSASFPQTSESGHVEWRTTVMLRNLPNNYTREMVMTMLDAEAFAGQYDFLYLPIDFQSGASLGYAFVNCISADSAKCMWDVFLGYSGWMLPSKKKCIVSWSDPHQGLVANVDRYRNSPIMHPSVPDEHKPIVLMCGKRVPFLPPSKKLKAPRMRKVETDRRQPYPNGSAFDEPTELYYPALAHPLPDPQFDGSDSWPDQQYSFIGGSFRARAHSGF